MTTATPLKKIRQVGLGETYCTVRHHHGFYVAVAASAYYALPTAHPTPTASVSKSLSQQDLRNLIYSALHDLIFVQPMLSVTIRDEHTSNAYFAQLVQVDLDKVVRFVGLDEAFDEEGSGMDVVMQEEIRKNFKENMAQEWPCWRLTVVTPKVAAEGQDSQQTNTGVWMTWAFHHAIADGTGGTIFHRNLLKQLNKVWSKLGEANEPSGIFNIPNFPSTVPIPVENLPPLPPNLESIHPLPLSIPFLLKAVFAEYVYGASPRNLWTSAVCTAPDPDTGPKTNVVSIMISPEMVAKLIGKCKKHKVTMTPLLQALFSAVVLSVMGSREQNMVRMAIPVSMRRWLEKGLQGYADGKDDVIGSYVTAFKENHHASALGLNLRSKSSGGGSVKADFDFHKIWAEARRAKKALNKNLAKGGGDSGMGLLRYAGDLEAYFMSKVGKPRQESLEVTNVGLMKGDGISGQKTGGNRDQFGITEMRFCQSMNVTAAAITMNVVTVHKGRMCLAFTWQDECVPRESVEVVIRKLREVLEKIVI